MPCLVRFLFALLLCTAAVLAAENEGPPSVAAELRYSYEKGLDPKTVEALHKKYAMISASFDSLRETAAAIRDDRLAKGDRNSIPYEYNAQRVAVTQKWSETMQAEVSKITDMLNANKVPNGYKSAKGKRPKACAIVLPLLHHVAMVGVPFFNALEDTNRLFYETFCNTLIFSWSTLINGFSCVDGIDFLALEDLLDRIESMYFAPLQAYDPLFVQDPVMAQTGVTWIPFEELRELSRAGAITRSQELTQAMEENHKASDEEIQQTEEIVKMLEEHDFLELTGAESQALMLYQELLEMDNQAAEAYLHGQAQQKKTEL